MTDHNQGTRWTPRPRIHGFQLAQRSSTDIIVEQGLLQQTHLTLLLELSERSRHVLITDETVGRLHARPLHRRLTKRVRHLAYIEVPDGERTKSLAGFQRLATNVLELGPDEETTIVAIGGGMVCNLAGMLAATLFRGIRLVHIPTTLMAQCDAAISHKQAINGPSGKNLIGAYHAPARILVDPDVLSTLEPWQRRDGFAEVIKHALVQDVDYLRRLYDPDASLDDIGFLAECVERNIALKCELMRIDPEERNEGMVLQYGHTLGHAIEHASEFCLGHGESVAIGMLFAAHIASSIGVACPEVLDVHRELVARFGLPQAIPASIDNEELVRRVRAGKRCVDTTAHMALSAAPGVLYRENESCAVPVPIGLIRQALSSFRKAPARAVPYLLCGVVP